MSKSEEVKQVDRDANKGAAIKAAERQNLSDGKTGKGNLSQIPAGKDFPTTTTPSN